MRYGAGGEGFSEDTNGGRTPKKRDAKEEKRRRLLRERRFGWKISEGQSGSNKALKLHRACAQKGISCKGEPQWGADQGRYDRE